MQMTPMSYVTPSNAFEDPRCRIDYQARYYPTANGQAAPPIDATGQNSRIVLEFLAAYYHLNREYQRLLEIRKHPDSPQRREAERECLQAVEKVLIVRDRLEDVYAPLGVITDPVVSEGFTVDVSIKFGNVDAAGRRRTDLYTLTAYVPIPMPEGAKLDDLPMKIEGPGFNGEY